MTKAEFEILFIDAINALRRQAFTPKDTGNLAYNAIKGIWIDDKRFRIYVDESIAPYMVFTNESWNKGTNPNENWFQKAVKFIATHISSKLNGELK
jgi:hypothetical protein